MVMATGERGRVSLGAPRPEGSRSQNEYVDTPLRRGEPTKKKGVETRQPGKKRPEGSAEESGVPAACSIICSECGKCRCEACRSPRRPPSFWLCSDFCYCSVDSCVDYSSCLCCVKGLMYHWSSDGDDASCADDPCSCSPSYWLGRWACLALSSLVLPCLCCYCPLRTCADSCQRAYAACSPRGCSCRLSPDLS